MVRLVNSGFGSGAEWDAQYDGLEQGWRLFLKNLQLHLAHFRGQAGRAMQPMATWAGDQSTVWAAVTDALGIPAAPAPGERIVSSGEVPAFAGTVVDSEPGFRISLLLESPLPGTALIAAESAGENSGVSIWMYLYGDEAEAVIARDEPRWSAWLAERAVPAPESRSGRLAGKGVAALEPGAAVIEGRGDDQGCCGLDQQVADPPGQVWLLPMGSVAYSATQTVGPSAKHSWRLNACMTTGRPLTVARSPARRDLRRVVAVRPGAR